MRWCLWVCVWLRVCVVFVPLRVALYFLIYADVCDLCAVRFCSKVLDLEFLNETSRLQRVVRDDGSVQSATAVAKL